MRKNKLLLLLALLMTAATGAWADETLLLTIESKDYKTFKSGSKTFDDKVTVTFSNSVYNYGNGDGWNAGSNASLLTVAGTNGYAVTSCKFYTENGPASTGYTVEGESPSVYLYNSAVYTDASKSVYKGYAGVTKIEVYGTAPAAAGYTVSLKDGVKDADKWTISPNPAPEGSPVTIQYTGRLKVKGVKATSDAAPAGNSVDLSTLTADYAAQDGDVLTGVTSSYKVTIADGATVTLDGVNISNGQIACSGNANIILMGANTVTAASEKAAIKIGGSGTTLTITGSGSLTAQGGVEAAGIGTDRNENGELSFGNIVINGGTVTATGGKEGAGIGTGLAQGEFYTTSITCGDITINGGTVTATGGDYGPGIGTGVFMKYGSETASNGCGAITIGAGVISVTATKGSGSPNSIGKGYAYGGTQNYGTVTIGGTKYWENNAAVNGGDTYLAQSPLIYDPAAWDGTITAQLAAKLAYTGGNTTDGLTTMTWAVGEHIAILYKVSGTKKVADAEITAVDGTTGAATIQFTVEDGTPDNTPCTLVYPYSAAKDDHTGVKDAATLLAAQDGTLSANLDVRVGEGTIQTTTPGLTVTTQPEAQFAIFKFTTKSVPSANGSLQNTDVTKLTVTIGAQDYVITPASATSTLYAALPAVSGQTVSFTATGGSNLNLYAASKASVSFDAAKYYQSTVKMGKVIEVFEDDDPILEDFTRNPSYKYLHIGLEQAYAIARQLSTQNTGATVAVVYNNENRNVTYALSSDASATARTLRGDNLFENNYRVFLATLWEDAD